MTKPEKLLFGARLNGASISTIPEDELDKILNQLVIRLTAICGCPLPNTDYFSNTLTREIKDFLNFFEYSSYTLNEFILAFHLNAYGGLKYANGEEIEQIKFTGAFLNIDYIAKVLNNYKHLRNLLDRKLQNHIDGYEF